LLSTCAGKERPEVQLSLNTELENSHLLREVRQSLLSLLGDTLEELCGVGQGQGISFDFLVIQGGLKFHLQLIS